jgi:hypothetical protein
LFDGDVDLFSFLGYMLLMEVIVTADGKEAERLLLASPRNTRALFNRREV